MIEPISHTGEFVFLQNKIEGKRPQKIKSLRFAYIPNIQAFYHTKLKLKLYESDR